MPIDYQVDHDHRIVLAAAHGTLSADDMFQYQQEVWSRPDVAGYDELVDMSDVRAAAQPTSDRIRALAERAAGMDAARGRGKFAIVAPQQEFFGLGRMYEAYREMASGTRSVAVFRDRAQALLWLAGGDSAPDAGSSGSSGAKPPG